jgi:hypothetical protein
LTAVAGDPAEWRKMPVSPLNLPLPPRFLPMKPINWGEGFWDDPNLRWGSPSYRLEPGDAGYVDPFPLPKHTTKHKKMKRNSFYPSRQGDQITWLMNFALKILARGAALGLTPAQINAIVADCLWLIYLLQSWLPEVRTWAQGCTQSLAIAESGNPGAAQTLPAFTGPPLPGANAPLPATVAVSPGALDAFLRWCSKSKRAASARTTWRKIWALWAAKPRRRITPCWRRS